MALEFFVDGPEHGGRSGYMVECPGCGHSHAFYTSEGKPRWTFDGNMEKPTFTPSMNVKWSRTVDGQVIQRCHFILTAGVFHFLTDCTHQAAGTSI